MATHPAIAAVGRAMVNLLKDASRNEFPAAEFRLIQAADFAANRHPREGASICLVQVEINNTLRNTPPGPGRRIVRPPVSLQLRFLVTPWAATPEKQQRLLGWMIRTLNDTPILTAALLNQMAPNEVIFSPAETVELVFDPLSLSDQSILFQNLKQPGVLPSLTYRAALVLGEIDGG
jgi:hypothetical protein